MGWNGTTSITCLLLDRAASGSWCISSLLSLGADQVIRCQLRPWQWWCCCIPSWPLSSSWLATCYLWAYLTDYCWPLQQYNFFTSLPQALVNNIISCALYCCLLIDDLLKQLTVLDELQLSLKFCRCLHNECFALKNKVFAPLLLSGGKRSKISILFMTATATRTIFQQTTLLTGLTFCQWNVFWPGPSHMLYRGDAKYNLSWLHNHLAYLTSNVDKLYNKAMEGDAIQHQFVVFANSPSKVEVFPGAEKSILIWNSIHWQCHHHGHQHSIQDAKDEELYCLILARGSWLLLPCWQWNLWCHCLLSYSYDWRHWLGLLPHSQWGAVRPSNRYLLGR